MKSDQIISEKKKRARLFDRLSEIKNNLRNFDKTLQEVCEEYMLMTYGEQNQLTLIEKTEEIISELLYVRGSISLMTSKLAGFYLTQEGDENGEPSETLVQEH